MSIALLMSGAYVTDELAAEFGHLPPTFLPVGGKRLYELQAKLLCDTADRLVMTLPEKFKIPVSDLALLDDLNIERVPVLEGLSLGESIVYTLNILGVSDELIKILHGDTFFSSQIDGAIDIVSVHKPHTAYNWATYVNINDKKIEFRNITDIIESENVLSGYFNFSSSTELVKSIVRARGNFINGLNIYNNTKPLKPVTTGGDWLDFGHIQTYYESRWFLMSHRHFNDVNIDGQTVSKLSYNNDKMKSEIHWYNNIPRSFYIYTPAFIDETNVEGKIGYKISHEYLSTVSDLYVFGRLDPLMWVRIFDSCSEFLELCGGYGVVHDVKDEALRLYGPKTMERLDVYCASNDLDIGAEWIVNKNKLPSLKEIVLTLDNFIRSDDLYVPGIIHGDLCFSNILYDFRRRSIKVIDPRGHLSTDKPCIYGDIRYDIAKLSHSAIGMYDYIIANRFHCNRESKYNIILKFEDDEIVEKIQAEFNNRNFAGISPLAPSVRAATALLFFSMLPLHSDSPGRQEALLARGLSLYLELMESLP